MRKATLVILGLFIWISCNSTRNSGQSAEKIQESPSVQAVLDSTLIPVTINMPSNMNEMGDPYSILEAEIFGNILRLKVQYGGGCREHEFEPVTNFAFSETTNEEGNTLPPSIRIVIKHNGNDDHCRAILQKELFIDVRNLRDKGQHKIRVLLTGWDTPLIYTYIE